MADAKFADGEDEVEGVWWGVERSKIELPI